MITIFNVQFEFDKDQVIEIINNTINQNQKGYVCIVDGNVLTNANNSDDFLNIVNNSIINICDGSSIAMMASSLHKQNFDTFTGPDLFIQLLNQRNKKSYFLGNEPKVLNGLKKNILKIDPKVEHMLFEALPFMSAENFDYEAIGNKINEENPDLIWISLGAPKQEDFMYRLKPFINRGVMLGVGAVFNFYSDQSKENRAPIIIQKLQLEWIYRTIFNPKKQLPKAISFLKVIPKLYLSERRKKVD